MIDISEFKIIVTGDILEKLSVIASDHHCSVNDLLTDLIKTYVDLYDYSQFHEVLR